MKCDCIKTIGEKLKEQSKDPEASLDVMFTFPEMNALIYVPYTYRKIKKDGTFSKPITGKLALHKCPFCGTECI